MKAKLVAVDTESETSASVSEAELPLDGDEGVSTSDVTSAELSVLLMPTASVKFSRASDAIRASDVEFVESSRWSCGAASW